ncbi:hypothetical protein M409DRAFT_37639 [Zasmidium cellare ATCC 36951]|uniref:Xylose isomerase-like TIM barrel domain-containing protein n=1 Tax=Zasmidium cellare ATCC 36951 TaxID=1080233 RepID=A0A6A6C241_ZASCE|nr:uncharacterized protein M409DRAFT_37639 [Zasmidium cellare ATCC 36951]KAF2161045.1 hypothetical protein M409DRAFT_37639 [Zasmidium cellare ATCC 36951]
MKKFRPAIMSASLGRAAVHQFDQKVQEAARAGFEGIEIFYEDLEQLAKTLYDTDVPDTQHLLYAARRMRVTLDNVGLQVIGLQPFLFYEGLKDRNKHQELIKKLHVWIDLTKILGTNTIQIPGNFLPAEEITDDPKVIVDDMREVADIGLLQDPPIRFAYESLCWSTYIDTWEKSWEIVRLVDRPNFGVCLDTFNIAGRVWADPSSPDGKTPNADEDLAASLRRMLTDLDLEKVFYIQVVDAERMDPPLLPGHPFHTEGNPARMSWSRNARTFMYEESRGAYLPVEAVARTLIHELGYKGYVSMELFSKTMSDPSTDVPKTHAQRGIQAWQKLVERLSLD